MKPVGRTGQTGNRTPGKIPILIGGSASGRSGVSAGKTGEKVAVKAVGSTPASATKAEGKSPVRVDETSGRIVRGSNGNIVPPGTTVGKTVRGGMSQRSDEASKQNMQKNGEE